MCIRDRLQAVAELGVKSPLREAGLTKAEIRELSKEMELSTWEKPSFACLASRFVYGETISKEKLIMVENADVYKRQVQDEDYDDCFGFTEQEVKELLAYCKAEFSDELKKMYDCLLYTSDMLMDISDYEGLDSIKQAYLDIDKALEFVPEDGVYAVPYVANAAGVLYNRAMFEEYGWEIPETWDEFIALCEQIQSEGIQPLYFGFKDTWTCLAPWNAIAVDLAPADVCSQVNKGEMCIRDSGCTIHLYEPGQPTQDYAESRQFEPF